MIYTPENIWLTVITGYSFEKISGKIYKFYLPTLTLLQDARQYSLLVHDLYSLPTQEELELNILHYMNEDDVQLLESYQEKYQDLQIRIELTSVFSEQEVLRAKLNRLVDDYESALRKKINLIAMSRDGIMQQVESHYCFYQCVRNDKNQPLWESFDEYLDSPLLEKADVLIAYNDFCTELTSDTQLRKVAKQAEYRALFKSAIESGIPVFHEMKLMSKAALRLLYWMHLYSNVISHSTEAIPQEIIDDDDRFDQYIETLERGGAPSTPAQGQTIHFDILGS